MEGVDAVFTYTVKGDKLTVKDDSGADVVYTKK